MGRCGVGYTRGAEPWVGGWVGGWALLKGLRPTTSAETSQRQWRCARMSGAPPPTPAALLRCTQVLRGGENLLDKVEALEAAAAAQREALAAQRAAAAAAEARAAELEAAAAAAEGQYSSVQVGARRAVAGCVHERWLPARGSVP